MEQASRFPLFAFVAVALAALVSGASALAYELVWSRMLATVLGNSADAAAVVLAAFMLGMALGARLLGGLADRLSTPLKLYSTLELMLGAYSFAVPVLLREVDDASFLSGLVRNPQLIEPARFVAAGALVAIPAMAIGATLPILIRALAAVSSDIRFRAGVVLGVNTLGAAGGAFAAGFLGIPMAGLAATGKVAAMGSFFAAVIVFATASLMELVKPKVGRTPRFVAALEVAPGPAVEGVALIAAFVSGFVLLAAELLWSRLLSFVFGYDTYAFAVLLAVVLAGLGLGGLLHRLLVRANPLLLVAALLGLSALTLAGSFWAASALVVRLGRDPFGLSALEGIANPLWLELYREAAYTPLLAFVPALISGAAFPAALGLYGGPADQAGVRIGRAALINGLGAIAGALTAPFVLVPLIGIERSFFALAGAAAAGSLFAVWVAVRTRENALLWFLATPAAIVPLLCLATPAELPKAMLLEAVGPRHQRIAHYEEGRTGTVSITENRLNGERQLFMNAVNEVSTRLVHDQSFKLLGHLGPLLHPYPEKGLMICLGAGISAGAALAHPFKRLDVVEISPAVPRAARLWKESNNRALDDPRLALHIGDGRHFLKKSAGRFDVVMVDSTHPKAIDSWLLYTAEFYALVKSRLSDDGIAVQWVPLHGLSENEFKIVVRTFQSVFRETTLWVNVGYETYGAAAYVKLVGTNAPLRIDIRELALRLREPQIARDLAPFGMDSPAAILDAFLAGPAELAEWTAGLPVQTDNQPILPFITPYASGRRMEADLLLAARASVVPLLTDLGPGEYAFLRELAQASEANGFLLSGDLERAAQAWPGSRKLPLYQAQAAGSRDYYLALAKLYPDDPKKLFEIGSYLGNLGFAKEARQIYEQVLRLRPTDRRTRLNLALVLLDLGETDAAEKRLEELVQESPKNGLYRFNLGIVLARSGDQAGAVEQLRKAVEALPDLVGAQLALADALLGLSKLDEAEPLLQAIVARNRFVAEAWDMLGLVAARRGDWSTAKQNHVKAVRLEPYRASSHYNLGIALQETGRLREAAEAYEAALAIEPRDADAENNLGLVYAAGGFFEKARDAHRKALEIEPDFPAAAYNLGLAEKELGRIAEAAEAFRLALKQNPDLAAAKKQLDALEAAPAKDRK